MRPAVADSRPASVKPRPVADQGLGAAVRNERPRPRRKRLQQAGLARAVVATDQVAAASASSSSARCDAAEILDVERVEAHRVRRQHHRRIGITTNLGALRRRGTNQATAVAVGQADLDLRSIDRCQRIHQVIDVEADLDLLAVVGRPRSPPRLLPAPDCAPGWSASSASPQSGCRGISRSTGSRPAAAPGAVLPPAVIKRGGLIRDHPAVFREPSIDQLRSEANVADLGANVIAFRSPAPGSDPHRRGSAATPARPCAARSPAGPVCRLPADRPRTETADGRRSRQLAAISPKFQQHAVQVIADILLRHREMRLVDQPLEIRLRHACSVCCALISSTAGTPRPAGSTA